MKIGLVRRGWSRTGGAEAYLRRFAETAVAAGHEVILFAEQWPREAWPWAHVQVHSRSPVQFAAGLHALRPRERCDFLFSLERIFSCDAYRAGDGVHAEWLARRAEFEPFWKPWLRRFSGKHKQTLALERHLFAEKGAEFVIANSRMVAEEIQRHFAYPADQIAVVYNGVPAFAPPPGAREITRRDLGMRDDQLALLFVGSGWERKGLRFAIEAVNALPKSARLFVIGRGSSRGLPRSRRTRFLGAMQDVSRFLAAVDAFILPTIYEPFSNACLEALAAGLPVITTRHNGFSEIIAPGADGESIDDPRDIAALTAAIERWRDPARREASRARLQALGAKFSLAENVRQTLALIAR
ncbi:MAG TPA: glycosyltransferase family 4 protein [Chthoniobacteraceae bacterium]|nr:glycosyltransferase family 4 protein [Chthoniobacteraceae bacterium]